MAVSGQILLAASGQNWMAADTQQACEKSVVLQVAGGPTRFTPNVAPHRHARCNTRGELADVRVHQLDPLQVSGFDCFAADRVIIVFGGLSAACQPSPTNSTKEQS